MTPPSLADLGSLAAAFFALIALIFGMFQFWKTQKLAQNNLNLQREILDHEREAVAMDLFVRFSELKQLTDCIASDPSDKSQFWRHNAALAIIEAIYKITKKDPEWSATVRWMLESHRDFILGISIEGTTFTPEFVVLMKDTVPGADVICAASQVSRAK